MLNALSAGGGYHISKPARLCIAVVNLLLFAHSSVQAQSRSSSPVSAYIEQIQNNFFESNNCPTSLNAGASCTVHSPETKPLNNRLSLITGPRKRNPTKRQKFRMICTSAEA